MIEIGNLLNAVDRCPGCDCGAGELHDSECHVQVCSVCGDQRVACDCCCHDSFLSAWTGRMPVRKNFPASNELARDNRINAKPDQGYCNCFKAVHYCEEFEAATYVEGFVFADGFYFHHGWLEIDDQIVDPTLPDKEAVYISGLRFEGTPGISKALRMPKPERCYDLPFFNRFGDQGCNSPEFSTAKLIAERLVELKAFSEFSERLSLLGIVEQSDDNADDSLVRRYMKTLNEITNREEGRDRAART